MSSNGTQEIQAKPEKFPDNSLSIEIPSDKKEPNALLIVKKWMVLFSYSMVSYFPLFPLNIFSMSSGGIWDTYSAVIELAQSYYGLENESQVLLFSNVYLYTSIIFAIPVDYSIGCLTPFETGHSGLLQILQVFSDFCLGNHFNWSDFEVLGL